MHLFLVASLLLSPQHLEQVLSSGWSFRPETRQTGAVCVLWAEAEVIVQGADLTRVLLENISRPRCPLFHVPFLTRSCESVKFEIPRPPHAFDKLTNVLPNLSLSVRAELTKYWYEWVDV